MYATAANGTVRLGFNVLDGRMAGAVGQQSPDASDGSKDAALAARAQDVLFATAVDARHEARPSKRGSLLQP